MREAEEQRFVEQLVAHPSRLAPFSRPGGRRCRQHVDAVRPSAAQCARDGVGGELCEDRIDFGRRRGPHGAGS